MNSSSARLTLSLAGVLALLVSCGSASADVLLTVPTGTFIVRDGVPWTMPETNYHFRITTDGSDGLEGVNAEGQPEHPVDLGIDHWRDFAAYGKVYITGNIPAGGLQFSDSDTVLQIGLISRTHASAAAGSRLSDMLHNSVYLQVVRDGQQYAMFVGDYEGCSSLPDMLLFDPSQPVRFELQIDNATRIASVRIRTCTDGIWSEWSEPVSTSFGGPSDTPDDLSQAAFIIQLASSSSAEGQSRVTFGDIVVSSEPVSDTAFLSLHVQPQTMYVRSGEPVTIDLDVSNLDRMVNGCQALLGYSSAYFLQRGFVVPGDWPWTELIYESWNAAQGELDTAIGVQLDGPIGTDADATVAIVNLVAGPNEGITRIIFRPDGEHGYATMLSDISAQPIWPVKIDSARIVIDNTPPTNVAIVADPAGWTNVQTVTLTFSADDPLAGIDHYELQVDDGPFFRAGSPYALDVSSLSEGQHIVTVKATDRADNWATADTAIHLDRTPPAVSIESVRQNGVELLGTGIDAVQGPVDIYVAVEDALSGLDDPPAVEVTPQGGVPQPAVFVEKVGNIYRYAWQVTSSTPNGTATVSAQATDRAGNTATAVPGQFTVNKNQITGLVQLERFVGNSRDVTFVATDAAGTVLKTWTRTLTFAAGTADYTLTDVPSGTKYLSAKTAWNLRRRLPVVFAERVQTVGDVNATITRTDRADGVEFRIEIHDASSPYGVSVALGTVNSAAQGVPAFRVYFAESGDRQWHYQEFGTDWNGPDTTELPAGFSVEGSEDSPVFIVTVPYSALGAEGPGSRYYWACQVRTTLLGYYPATWTPNWNGDISTYAVSNGSQMVVNFTGDSMLPGGDLNGDNLVNMLDYSVLKTNWFTVNDAADINGDGWVQILDYSIMKSNWFRHGDPQ